MQLLPELLPSAEPLGPFTKVSLTKLRTTINQPFVSFGGYYPYRFIYHKAAALFYFTVKDHCFENGNKRTAVVLTMVFLVKNGKMLNFSPDDLYDIACEVAESDAANKDTEIERLKQRFKETIADLPPDS